VKLACVGDVGVDDYANLGLRKPGGIALNVAANARACGLDVSLVSALGDDPDGDAVLAAIAPPELDLSHLRRLPGLTARQSSHLDPGGERRFTGYRAGVLAEWRLNEGDLAFFAGHDALFAPLADGLEGVFEAVSGITGPFKSADFSIDSILLDGSTFEQSIARYAGSLDCCVMGGSGEHAPFVANLAALHPERIFVLTLGSEGALAFHRAGQYHQSAIPVERVVDTTGCGDAFHAAFLASYLRERDIPAALLAGVIQAAAVIGRIGSVELVLT
jgi:fructoselysine 6-kinase